MKYKFLQHTADAKFQSYGKTLEEAFSNAALAMMSLLIEPEKVKVKIRKVIEIDAESEEALLYDFLSRFLFLFDAEGFILNNIKKIEIKKDEQKFRLKAELIGDNNKNYQVHPVVKAVTYNSMFIKKEKDIYTVQVVVDT